MQPGASLIRELTKHARDELNVRGAVTLTIHFLARPLGHSHRGILGFLLRATRTRTIYDRFRSPQVPGRFDKRLNLVLRTDVVGGPHLFYLQVFGDDFQRVGLSAKGDEIRRGEIGVFVRGHRERNDVWSYEGRRLTFL